MSDFCVELISLVEEFIAVSNLMLLENIITRKQYDEMVSNKIYFLKRIGKAAVDIDITRVVQ